MKEQRKEGRREEGDEGKKEEKQNQEMPTLTCSSNVHDQTQDLHHKFIFT